LDGLAGDDVGVYNLVHIGQGHAAIPHRFGINDKVRSVLALV